MRRRSVITSVASGVLALVLLIALAKIAQVDLAHLLDLLAEVKLLPFAALMLLTSLNILLAGEKWRLVQERMTPGAELSRRLCFCFTAIGMAAGQFLPMQVATALTRSLGTHVVTGTGAVRGALATVFEQMFDVSVVALCGLVSGYCLWSGDLGWWAAGAAAAVTSGYMLVGPALATAAAATKWLATAHSIVGDRIRRFGRTLAESGLFEQQLTRRLFALSVFRFVVLWLMAVATTHAVGLNISSLQLAAALPLVVLATAVAVTPGGIGVNEWTFAAALAGLGVDFETATQCALVNRVLVAAAALTIGVAGVVAAQLAEKNPASGNADSIEHQSGALADR